MKHVVRYLLEGDGSIPSFIEDGGYFSIGEEKVGISVDSSKRYVPATVIRLTRAELNARIKSCSQNLDGSDLTDEQASELAQNLLSRNGMENYE